MPIEQAKSNSKEQFARSPDLPKESHERRFGCTGAHGSMSKQALDSAKLWGEMEDVLLGSVKLYAELTERGV